MNRPSLFRSTALGALVVALAGGLTVLVPTPVAAAPFGPSPERLADVSVHGRGVVLGGRLYFAGEDATHGVELWSTDGTAAGTRMVRDLVPGTSGSTPTGLTVYGGRVLFRANDPAVGNELWSSDGTAAGTRLVRDIYPGGTSSTPGELTVAGGRLYFAASHPGFGRELWTTDGTDAGTQPMVDLVPGAGSGQVHALTALGSTLVFAGEASPGVSKPWVTDGTTVSRLDSSAAGVNLNVTEIEAVGDRAVLAAGDQTTGVEVWVTRGAPGDAVPLRDIQVGDIASTPSGLTRFGDQVYFSADRTTDGRELWTTDGTPGGTQLLREIRPGFLGSDPATFTGAGDDFLAFTAGDGVHGTELWVTGGTPASTRMLRDIAPGAASGVNPMDDSLMTVAGQLFFAGDDVKGAEPWISDGTTEGTRLLADLTPGGSPSNPRPVGVLGSTVVFANQTGVRGLWGYTVSTSRTVPRPKPSYSVRKAKKRKVVVPVRVEAAAVRPSGAITLTLDGRVVGRAVAVRGEAGVRITIRLRKGRHRLVAQFAGSADARASQSAPFVVRVR